MYPGFTKTFVFRVALFVMLSVGLNFVNFAYMNYQISATEQRLQESQERVTSLLLAWEDETWAQYKDIRNLQETVQILSDRVDAGKEETLSLSLPINNPQMCSLPPMPN